MLDNPIQKKEGKEVKIELDQEMCISVGSCVAIAGKTFELDEDGLAVITDPSGNTQAEIIAAAQSCPTKAIIVHDKDGNQLWPND